MPRRKNRSLCKVKDDPLRFLPMIISWTSGSIDVDGRLEAWPLSSSAMLVDPGTLSDGFGFVLF